MFTRANQTHWLKEMFPAGSQIVDRIGVEKGRFLNRMKKTTKGFGNTYDIPAEYSRLISAGASFAKAQALAAATATNGAKFKTSEVSEYAIEQVQGNLLRKAKASDEGMVKKEVGIKAARAFNTAFHRASRLVYGTGSGAIGRISASTTLNGDTLILQNPSDALFFDKDMKIVAADTDLGDALHSSGATLTVDKVTNRRLGHVKVTAADMSAVWSEIAAGDYLFIDGDREDDATPERLVPRGFAAWVPKDAPSASEDFFGVDRSVDSRLYGHRLPAAGMDMYEALIEASFLVQDDGDEITDIYLHPRRMKNLIKEAEGKTWLTHGTVSGKTPSGLEISYDSVRVRTDDGVVNVISDRYCPYDFAAGVRMDDWELRSEGPWPTFMVFDGEYFTLPSADGVELRVGGDWNVVCYAPNNQVYIDFTAS